MASLKTNGTTAAQIKADVETALARLTSVANDIRLPAAPAPTHDLELTLSVDTLIEANTLLARTLRTILAISTETGTSASPEQDRILPLRWPGDRSLNRALRHLRHHDIATFGQLSQLTDTDLRAMRIQPLGIERLKQFLERHGLHLMDDPSHHSS